MVHKRHIQALALAATDDLLVGRGFDGRVWTWDLSSTLGWQQPLPGTPCGSKSMGTGLTGYWHWLWDDPITPLPATRNEAPQLIGWLPTKWTTDLNPCNIKVGDTADGVVVSISDAGGFEDPISLYACLGWRGQ